MSVHTSDQECPGCKAFLSECHIALLDWFTWVKWQHKDVHVAQGFRNEAQQNTDFSQKKTDVPWPKSKHNFMMEGQACSLAVDIFQIDIAGKAIFDGQFYKQVYEESAAEGYPIVWGGNWKGRAAKLGDNDHFELAQEAVVADASVESSILKGDKKS